MHFIIAGGTGLIGRQLVAYWLSQGHEITVLGRDKARIEKQFAGRVNALTWNELTPDAICGVAGIVNLTGANLGEKRWDEARKKLIVESRVETTKALAIVIANTPNAPKLYNASAIGVYGLQKQEGDAFPPRLDETAPIDWDKAPDFLSQVGRAWEKAVEPALTVHKPVVFLRFGIVLAANGGALPMLLKPFDFFVGGPIGSGNQPFSWVAIDDVVLAIDFLTKLPDAEGAYNIVAESVPQRLVAEAIAAALNRPDVVKMPSFLLKPMLGDEMAQELLLEGQRVYSSRLLAAGFKFTQPKIGPAIRYLLRDRARPENKAQAGINSAAESVKGAFNKIWDRFNKKK